jgi:hypothetical protein
MSPSFTQLVLSVFNPRHFCFVKRKANEEANKIGERSLQTLHQVWTFDQNGNVCVYVCCVCVNPPVFSRQPWWHSFVFLSFILSQRWILILFSFWCFVLFFFFLYLGCSKDLRSSLEVKTIWSFSETAENEMWWDVPLLLGKSLIY